jgi:hypothetical protein
MKVADVQLNRLDQTQMKRPPNFIKIDVEGYELKVLTGGVKTIEKHRPTMAIEINRVALERQGTSPNQVFDWLHQHDYSWRIIEENARRSDPLYNIIALPGEPVVELKSGKEATFTAAQVITEISPETAHDFTLADCVQFLRDYADRGKEQRKTVNRLLRKAQFIR